MSGRAGATGGTRGTGRRVVRLVAAIALAAGWLVPVPAPAIAADPPDRVEGRSVYDDGLLGGAGGIGETMTSVIESMRAAYDVEIVVVGRTIDPAPAAPTIEAAEIVRGIVRDWNLSRAVVLAVVGGPDGCGGGAAIAATASLPGSTVDPDRIVSEVMAPDLARCDPQTAILEGLIEVVEALAGIAPSGDPTASAGPPFPEPELDRAVYDQAGVFDPATIVSAEATIDAIEARTGAEVVVYSQVVPYGITTEQAEGHAQALMDQWGIGRRGIDDGLVILFDLDPSLEHGQVQLFAGPGYRAAYLSNAERQRIFEEDMLPFLQRADLDGALLVALERVDANATPEHAATLERARQVDAALGLIGAPILFVGLVGSAMWAWMRYGRDPVYLDDPSIHMAGPPAELTPAAATFVLAGESSRRALTTALLDLASRGMIAFREESELLGLRKKVGVLIDPPVPDALTRARQARNSARPLGPAETLAGRELAKLATGEERYIEPGELLAFGTEVARFDQALETHVVRKGWFREPPTKANGRWLARGIGAVVLGGLAIFGAINLPSGGLTLIAVALIAGGIVVAVISRSMEAVTLPGAMIRAMLAAYRRTLKKTMEQARSMDQVVAEAGYDWLETPDQAVVWGTALGLHDEIEKVLERSLDDLKAGRASVGSTYVPTWYGSGAGGGSAGGGGGLMSSSAVPNIGGMLAVLGSIGNAPSSNGGGGGFGGGGSGGGGGGAGGGF